MASYKESHVARPPGQHRLSTSSAPSHNIPVRHPTSRHHSHSISLSSVNASHRVTRRKSMTSTAVNNVAAIVAAVGVAEEPTGPSQPSRRRSYTVKSGGGRVVDSAPVGKTNSMHHAGRTRGNDGGFDGEPESAMDESVVVDGGAGLDGVGNISQARARRASEGSYLSRNEGKKSNGELRCEKCGKGYKHSSCLTKHLWEHTPEWNVTSKLLISKHQQVQLLEAASVLVGMNQDFSASPESVRTNDSDQSSDSPAASGTSEPLDDEYSSSAETTPPPTSERAYSSHGIITGRFKRDSSNSSVFSRSYQSAPSSSLPGAPPSVGTSYGSYYHPGIPRYPSASGFIHFNNPALDEEEAELARAVESLCSFGTPRTAPVHLPADIPPVPPLPARFAGHNVNRISANMAYSNLQPNRDMLPPSRQPLSDESDIKMGEVTSDDDDDDDDDDEDYDERSISHGRSDEDDDGVFGRMEE